MAIRQRDYFSRDDILSAYRATKSIADMAKRLGVSYGTALTLVNRSEISKRRQGYNQPDLPITGNQGRHAREFLGMTRDEFCALACVSKTCLRQFELGKQNVRESSMAKIMAVFDSRGITFNEDGTFQSS